MRLLNGLRIAAAIDLIVDVNLTKLDGAIDSRPIHTNGKGVAWTSSSFEYYQPIREATQKFTAVLLDRAVGRKAPAASP